MSKKSLQSLFAQKSWANSELFNALAEIPTEQHADAVHTATRTLNHIYVVDQIFQAHLLDEGHGFEATNTDATPSLNELQFAVAETDAWFEGYAASITGAELDESISLNFTDGDVGTMTREEMLFHVITHGAYHRGNVGQIMKFISIVKLKLTPFDGRLARAQVSRKPDIDQSYQLAYASRLRSSPCKSSPPAKHAPISTA
jgi:uncharacterized damage-inducible protein DinB